MEVFDKSILLVGESGVGKTHYGAQLLKRLMQEDGRIKMRGAATNLQPFEAVIASLDVGLSADHTATSVYHESRWPIVDDQGRKADLIWPDYGGEQVKDIIDDRRLPRAWLTRIAESSAWLLMIRLQTTRAADDVFSRPLRSLKGNSKESREGRLSDQARLIELLQILIYAHSTSGRRIGRLPRLVVLLTCWDEMKNPGTPIDVLHERLPMFSDFVASNWTDCSVLGLSALARSLDRKKPCCFPLYLVRAPHELTGLFRRRISWDDGAIRDTSDRGEAAFLMTDGCRSDADAVARAALGPRSQAPA